MKKELEKFDESSKNDHPHRLAKSNTEKNAKFENARRKWILILEKQSKTDWLCNYVNVYK